jgi:photosystem II stability/assembly factor-like uncharacterized protein
MKKTLIWLTAIITVTILTLTITHQLKESRGAFSEDLEIGEEEEEREERETGVEKQLSMWFQARAYPDPYYLDDKFNKAWLHAKAMRTPEASNAFQSRVNFGGWTSLGGPNVGRVLSIAINPTTPTTLFIGSASGGIWKSTNSGTSWTYVTTGYNVLGVPALIYHPTNSNIILAGTGEVYRSDTSNIGFNIWKARGTYGVGILRSTDGGTTWSQVLIKNMPNLFGVQMIKFDPNNANNVYACTTGGLYKSTDGGATWGGTPILNKIYVSDVVINSTNSNQMMAAVGNLVNSDKGIYRSTDGGTNWTKLVTSGTVKISSNFGGFTRFCYLNGNTVFASVGRDDYSGQDELFRSIDFGVTFDSLNNSHHSQYQFWCANVATPNPSNTDEIILGGVSLYRYTISTTTRSNITGTVHSDIHDIEFDPSNSAIFYVASDGGMSRTTNGGASFTTINTGLNIAQFYASLGVSTTNANLYIGGLQDNGVWSYNGATWTNRVGGDGGACIITPGNDNIVYASNDARKVNLSTGGVGGAYGTSLSSLAFIGDDRTAFMSPMAISKSTPATVYCLSDHIHKSTNAGGSWTFPTLGSMSNPFEATFKTGVAIAVSATNANKIYLSSSPFSQRVDNTLNVTGQPNVFRSTNGGTSVTSIKGTLPDRFVLDFAISPTFDDSVFVVLGGYGSPSHVYVSGDGGTNWTARGTGLPDVPFNAIAIDPVNPQIIYAGCDLGVYASPNRGATWYDFNTGFTDIVQVFDLQITAGNQILAVTHGKGVYRSALFNAAILPVVMREFTGYYQNGANKLQWITDQEVNSKEFILERSINGGSYFRVATIAARNQNTVSTYQYSDPVNSRQTATYFYRLKIVDQDGSFKYSSIVSTQVNSKSEFNITTNPVKDQLKGNIMLNERQTVYMNIYDAGGRLVLRKSFIGERGNNAFTISEIQQVPKGIYMVEAVVNKQRFIERLLKN